jgi:hypothetical protein
MWGRVIIGAVVVVLLIVWLAAIYLMVVDPRTLLQKWQGGLWNGTNWPVGRLLAFECNDINP